MNLGVWRMKDFMQSMCNVFVEVYAYIYIWARFMVLYLIHYFSGGPEKHARPYIHMPDFLVLALTSHVKSWVEKGRFGSPFG